MPLKATGYESGSNPTTYFTMKTFYEMAVYVGESMLTTGIRNVSHNSNSSPSQDYPNPAQ